MPLLFLGPQELMVIGLIVLLIFGGAKLPQLGSGLGQAIRNFKDGVNETKEDKKLEETKDAETKS